MSGLPTFFAGTKRDVLHASGKDIAQLGTDHGPALAGLEVLEIHYFVGRALHFDFKALAKVGG